MSKALLGNNKTMAFYDVISYFRQIEKVENRNFFVFYPICLKFSI